VVLHSHGPLSGPLSNITWNKLKDQHCDIFVCKDHFNGTIENALPHLLKLKARDLYDLRELRDGS
jgi:hypothetical protein